jgi:hypothetical protein
VEYLRRYGSHRDSWDPPDPDSKRPEAEWGFEPTLRDSLINFARRNGYNLRSMAFGHPEDFSPFVADLYSWWYRQRGIEPTSLVAESFILLEPWWMLRTGSVPFWMVFNVEPSATALEHFLKSRSFESIYIMLFSHGVDSVAVAPISRWKALASQAKNHGGLLGVDESTYPRDFASFVRYHTHFRRVLRERFEIPAPLSIDHLDGFLRDNALKYRVVWTQQPQTATFPEKKAA